MSDCCLLPIEHFSRLYYGVNKTHIDEMMMYTLHRPTRLARLYCASSKGKKQFADRHVAPIIHTRSNHTKYLFGSRADMLLLFDCIFLVEMHRYQYYRGTSWPFSYAISAYHHWSCEFEPRWWRGLHIILCDKKSLNIPKGQSETKKNRQYNGQKKNSKRTNNDRQNIHIKLKIK